MSKRRLPKYVSEFADRHGKIRVIFRRKEQSSYYFKAAPWSAEFMQEYKACLDRVAAPLIEPGASRSKPGTFNYLISIYYNSPEFKGMRDITRSTYRGILERFRAKHGDKRVATIERKHIKAIVGAMSDRPSAANKLLKILKMLMSLGIDVGLRRDNPTIGLRGFKEKGEGYHSWSEEEILQFEKTHPIGSKARLAFALMLYTGQRRSDAVTMGWQHIHDGRIKVSQHKTGTRLEIPIHRTLQHIISATPRDNMTFLVTSYDKPFKPAGFGNWFRDRCNEAGLPQCSSHGLRKAAARRLAEAGCTNQQIKAITGHRTESEVARYTAAADQVKLAEQAMAVAYGAKEERKVSNRNKRLDILASNLLKNKDKK